MFSRLDAQKKSAYFIAVVLTLLILAATVLSVRGHILRDRAKRRLEHTNMLLNATLENMPQGICMFGADRRLVLANDLYSKMYGLNPEDVKPGTTLPEISAGRIRVGFVPAGPAEICQGSDRGSVPAGPGIRHQRTQGRPDILGQPQGHARWRFRRRPPGHHRASACRAGTR